MLHVSIVTLFPELYREFLSTSLIKRAIEKKIVLFNLVSVHTLTPPKVPIDAPTVGPGPGMLLKPSVIAAGVEKAELAHGKGIRIFFSPQGAKLSQPVLHTFYETIFSDLLKQNGEVACPSQAENTHIILVCPRYEGIDTRSEKTLANHVFSIGDYVLMGGDLPAQVFLEAFLRYFPGILGNHDSFITDSFQESLLDHDEYTLPNHWENLEIPPILQSGNHQKIHEWRLDNALKKTIFNRFDWFRSFLHKNQTLEKIRTIIPPHYIAFMHTEVMLKGGTEGTTSVTSIDIHDVARSATTYGIKKVFIVTPLKDQQEIVTTFLDFWKSNEGKKYNENRSEATSSVVIVSSYKEVENIIEAETGEKPLLISTGAKIRPHGRTIDYTDQKKIWREEKPVVIAFGTGQGLSENFIEKSDYLFTPIYGMTNFNHLSVRSAIGIILDRWLGLQQINWNKNKFF